MSGINLSFLGDVERFKHIRLGFFLVTVGEDKVGRERERQGSNESFLCVASIWKNTAWNTVRGIKTDREGMSKNLPLDVYVYVCAWCIRLFYSSNGLKHGENLFLLLLLLFSRRET